jgi:hypothetical protein
MAIQDDIKAAKQNQQKIPVYVVPDGYSGKASYGNERVGLSGPGAFQFPGKNVYSPFAPGTKTLGGRQQDLYEQKFQEELRQNKLAEAIAEQKRASGGSSGGSSRGYGGGSIPKMSKTELKAQYKEWLASLNDQYSYQDSQGKELWGQHNDPVAVALGAIENETNWLKEMGLGTADIDELKSYARNNLNTAAKQGYDLRLLKEPAKYDSGINLSFK